MTIASLWQKQWSAEYNIPTSIINPFNKPKDDDRKQNENDRIPSKSKAIYVEQPLISAAVVC